jgi:diguanylate cyclase (GGDEF)-like protein
LNYSLFNVLRSQHGDDFAPLKCNEQTVTRLVSYFEDVITENNLSAMVIEGRCLNGRVSREIERATKLTGAARHVYLFSCSPGCPTRTWDPEPSDNFTLLEEQAYHSTETGPFVLVMDPRFCGLLASRELAGDESPARNFEMVWTFDPNLIFTSVEYLMARISVQQPAERARLEALLNACTPHSNSLRLALSFTTKLTMLMQRQNELEMATNRISSAISSTLDIDKILQSAVEEVGLALNARRSALVLWQEGTTRPESISVYERPDSQPEPAVNLKGSESTANGETQAAITSAEDGSVTQTGGSSQPQASKPDSVGDDLALEPLIVSVTYRNSAVGELVVEDDTIGRVWEDEEVLMVKTVSDQLAVAIDHARLFLHVRTQAMTDSLTGLFNHGYFQEQLERETSRADRNGDPLSLILLDLDHLKKINDTHGHRAGDTALRHVARTMQSTVRNVDVCARYGGEEFVIILPQCGREDALKVAERLREAIAGSPLERIGQVTASIGVATYPGAAKSKEDLIEMADRAMYLSKAAGRNRVRTLMHHSYATISLDSQDPS